MRKNTNTVHVEGRVYQHSLEIKEVKNQNSPNFGKKYLAGTIEVATDEKGLNVVPVTFTYVTENTKAGGKNKTYTELMKIVESGKSWVTDGPEVATKVAIDTALGLNDFVAQDGTMISQKVNQGGFVSTVAELKEESMRNSFKTDILITNISRVEANPERYIDADYVSVKGAVFDFKNALLPVEFIVKHPGGMTYFEGLDVSSSQPLYTQVWGKLNYTTIATPTAVESAFGEAAVDIRERKVKEWVITGAAKVPYDFGDENIMTEEEVMKASQDRQVYLADIKKQREEYMAAKAAAPAANAFAASPTPTPANATAVQGKFNF